MKLTEMNIGTLKDTVYILNRIIACNEEIIKKRKTKGLTNEDLTICFGGFQR